MQLKKVRVTNYRSIDDSGWVNFEDVTCLVGKNEAGKTALLKALYILSPIDPASGKFNHVLDYPRKGLARYRQQHETQPATVIAAEFELSSREIEAIERDFGKGVLDSNKVLLTKNYKNESSCTITWDEKVVVNHIIGKYEGTLEVDTTKIATVSDFLMFLRDLPDKSPSLQELLSKTETEFAPGMFRLIFDRHIDRYLPRFVYFGDYSVMQGNIAIPNLIARRNQNQLDESDRTVLALLALAGASPEQMLNDQNYESLKSSLEAASITITDEVFEYWTQNKQLEVQFEISDPEPNAQPPLNSGKILRVRIRNNRHRVTVPFDQRSKGFVWFFSFFAYFSQLQNEDYGLILLLDEPGLSLHAKAQSDFLRFIEERLAPNYQVVYTTHSPFMIDPTRIDRVRMVQDVENQGTVVSADVMRTDRDTVFPLQAALGYELTQTLFVGPNCLLVEGPSDLLYLTIMSECLSERKMTGLDSRWTITPVGGADKVSTFVSLLGANELNIATLMDFSGKDIQRLRTLQENQLLGQSSIVKVTEFIQSDDGDIEDLFEPEFYLKLVNIAYKDQLAEPLTISDLTFNNPRIVKKVEHYFSSHSVEGGRFDHYKPATALLKHQTALFEQIDESSVQHWESLFARLNSLIN